MEQKTKLTKAIVFIVLTFIFAFILFTGKRPYFSSKENAKNLVADNSLSLKDTSKNTKNDIKPSQTSNANSEKEELIKNKKNLLGAWQVIEISSQGTTEKIDLTKPIPSEQNLIYNFETDTICVYWGSSKTTLSYTWTKKDTIQTIQPAASASEKDYKEWATVRIEGDKLYMDSVDVDNNKSSGVFARFKGELPKDTLKTKK